MKKISYILLASVAAVCSFTSCQKDEQPAANTDYIGISFLTTKAMLVNTQATYTSMTTPKIIASVYENGVADDAVAKVIPPKSESAWNSTSAQFETTQKYAWPVTAGNFRKTLDFYCWTPTAEGQSEPAFTRSTKTATFTYTAQTDTTKQRDIMFGYYSGTSSVSGSNTSGAAPVTFTHALAAVKFKVGSAPANCTINSLTISGVKDNGSCTVTFAGVSPYTSYVWDLDGSTSTQSYSPTETTAGAGYGVVATDEFIGKPLNALTFVPQTINNASAKIELSVTFSGDSTPTLFTYNINGKTLQQGKITTFKLNLSAVMSFTVEVDDWIPATGGDINLN